MKAPIKTEALQNFLGTGWQVMLGCIQHNFLEWPFSEQLEGDFLHFIEVSDEVLYVVAVTSFLREVLRPILASIFCGSFEEGFRIARQKNLNRIQLRHELMQLGVKLSNLPSWTPRGNKPVGTWKNGIHDIHLVGLIAHIDELLTRRKQHLNIPRIVLLDLFHVRSKSV